MRTRITVAGFSEPEVQIGLDGLLAEFRERPWIIRPSASWDGERDRLIVTAHYQGDDPAVVARLAFDEVRDCVIACMDFASDAIHFDVEESVVVDDQYSGA